MIKKIVSGGQTGVDRAGLDAAIGWGIDHGGWCPRGRQAEDGDIHVRYNLQCPVDGDSEEKEENIYNERTKLNIRDSDGTLIFVPKIPLPLSITDGTNLTIKEVRAKNKPYLMVDLSESFNPDIVAEWVKKNKIKTLNIAGPRESQSPGIYESTLRALKIFFVVLNIKNAQGELESNNANQSSFFSVNPKKNDLNNEYVMEPRMAKL
ncbi:MAG: molybdenum cofactor carrier [Gammaproteobacteria bacterium]|jgi:hypothetical protein|nr:molybdenum cofactor carrier [Gammaproteobacteria bacterium]